MALPCHPNGGAETGRLLIPGIDALHRILRTASLLTLAFGATGVAWTLAAPADRVAAAGLAPVAEDVRAVGLSRFRPMPALEAASSVGLQIDGLVVTLAAHPGDTAGDLFRAAGIALGPADRISVAIDTPLVPGMRITLDRGMPVTLVDGGREYAMRTRPGTVADFLGMSGISLGGQDVAVTPLDAIVSPNAVIRIDRVAAREVVEVQALPFAVTVVEDTGYEFGWSQIDRVGSNGEVQQTFIVRAVNGVESERVLVGTTELRAPVNEVRRIGARPRPAPAAPAEIEAIIRAAAARYGADPQQLLRVAWCESRYSPSAYNGILGASGLFQIIPGTWAANSVRAGYAGASVWDAYANANVAAWMFAHGQAGQWACK
ncbi:MAG: hypothetical protein NVSMB8_10440 [Candidatus Limnocylindrales bacterium]